MQCDHRSCGFRLKKAKQIMENYNLIVDYCDRLSWKNRNMSAFYENTKLKFPIKN